MRSRSLGFAGSLDSAVDSGSADGEEFGELGGCVLAGAVEPDEMGLLGSADHLRNNHSCRSLPMLDDMVFADLERTEIELASLF